VIFSLLNFLYRPWVMFFVSILACVSVLTIERFLGIEWNFHPDANNYLVTSGEKWQSIKEVFLGYQVYLEPLNPTMQTLLEKPVNPSVYRPFLEINITFDSILKGVSFLKGNLFYFIVDLFDSDIRFLIILNIFIYSITNSVIAIFFKDNCNLESQGFLGLIFLLVIFNPYRAHLSVHVLKDTLIIASLVFITINKSKAASIILFIVGVFLRNGWIIYFFSFIQFKGLLSKLKEKSSFHNNKFLLFTVLAVCLYLIWFIYYFWGTIYHVITMTNGNMTFRDFDSVPSYFELGVLGSVIRSMLWPILYMTGAFIFLSPTIFYFPIAVGSFCLNLWIIKHFKDLRSLVPVLLSVYASMAIFAFIVSGFTSFIRYCLPLIAILPILLINEDRRLVKKRKTLK
jgi:hypothetical protein